VSSAGRSDWDERHRAKAPGNPEPFVIEMLPMLPAGGRVLDVAAGRGRHSLALARAGHRVVAVDFAESAMAALAKTARAEHLPIWPVAGDFDNFALRDRSFDAIVNVNFLDRALFGQFTRALKPGGVLLADTFLVDQAEIGHPKDPRFLLGHYELRELIAGLELMRYREGLVVYTDGARAWRAGAVARRRS
jgi:SAM-dependent methyltransferase